MTPRHRRTCSRISVAIVLLSSLGLAAHASYRAEQADMRAALATATAELVGLRASRTRRVEVNWQPLEDRIERAERDAYEARVCSDWLLLVVRRLVTNWPKRAPLAEPPQWCPMPLATGNGTMGIGTVGEAREWPVRR